jgi:two-component system OmpR family sensor kinase
MRRLPIRIRVAGAFAVAMAIVLVGASWFVYTSLASHLTYALNHDLRLRADDLTALVQTPGDSLRGSNESRFVESGEAYAQLLDARGHVLDSTLPLESKSVLTPEELTRALRESFFANRDTVPGLDEPSRLLAAPVERSGQRLVLVVGTTRQDRAETLSSLRGQLLVAIPFALILATLAGYVLAGFALRPVEAMRRRAEEISAETQGERLPVPETGDEIERLGATLNSMLARLEGALERERDFVADAGHELRTPLALLRTELELALRHSDSAEELRAAIRAASEEAERLVQLAEDLLLIARTDKGELDLRLEPLEVPMLLASVATRFEWRAAEAGREVVAEAPPSGIVGGDRLRLEQALGNLIDNALRYGEGPVRLEARQSGSDVELHVLDDGAGFPVEFLPRAFERFTRASADRSGRSTGLGLSIVQTIASAHGGVAGAANRAQGGADVWIRVPLLVEEDSPEPAPTPALARD